MRLHNTRFTSPPSVPQRVRLHLCVVIIISVLSPLWSACDDEGSSSAPAETQQDANARLTLRVILPSISDESMMLDLTRVALSQAAHDLEEVSARVSGATLENETEGVSRFERQVIVVVSTDLDDELGSEGYELDSNDEGVEVRARTSIGAAYGLYHIAQSLGARYIHPEETHIIENPQVRLPEYEDERHLPHFKRRGFHEHTQHPIVMSEYLLRPNVEGYREGVSRYLLWMLRNRQNSLTFHMLNTLDLEAWIPYLSSITAEAAELGVDVGFITGFVDQQQNAFRLVMPDDPRSPEEQITAKLDAFTASGISLIGFQLGTSEFTKPDERQILEWLNLAVAHLAMSRPELEAYAWIHITCGLYQESGAPFYHIPLDADERLGAFVHTTMFYTIDHPAPVYDCEDFTHQRDFLDAASGERRQVFFPETAWWLGFDNNVPLVNPITGASREYDIVDALPTWDVEGHVTFTTGREWTYWQYDHYLTQVAWSGDLTWRDYLAWLAPIYGAHGEAVNTLISAWTDLQWRHLYEESPEIYFYLAGELPQDELGEQAGIIARRPKIAYREVLEMSDEEFEQWRSRDLTTLGRMLTEYQEIFESAPRLADEDDALYVELWTAYHLFIERLKHSIALYEGVSAARAGDRETAELKLGEAESIGAQALEEIRRVESLYRYPLELLTALNPESPTAYPFGYLHETSTGYFWVRREEQLAQLISDVFDAPPEEWGAEVTDPLLVGVGEEVNLIVPASPVLQNALGGFIPRLVARPMTLSEEAQTAQPEARGFVFGQDYNQNDLPDPGTALTVVAAPISDAEPEETRPALGWSGETERYPLIVRDASGVELGRLTLTTVQISFGIETAEDQMPSALWLSGEVTPDEVIGLVTSVAGIEPEALAQLIKQVWGIPSDEPLPELLPLSVRAPLSAVAD